MMRRGLVIMLAALLGCGDNDGTIPIDPAQRYLPLAVGASWTYVVTETGTGAVKSKTSTVEAEEDLGGDRAGTLAMRVRTEKLDGSTVSWQASVAEVVQRYHERAYDLSDALTEEVWFEPYRVRLDETPAHTALGARWTTSVTENTDDYTPGGVPSPTPVHSTLTKTESWEVLAVDESVTVPAGTFSCLAVHRVTSAGSDKTYWYAKGVGKVRERGLGQTEELESYTSP